MQHRHVTFATIILLTAGCYREAPPEVAAFRPPPVKVVEEATQPTPGASAVPTVAPTPSPVPAVGPTPTPGAGPSPVPEPTAEPTAAPSAGPIIVGSWQMSEMVVNGQSQPRPEGMEMKYTFAEDGTLTVSVSGAKLAQPQTMQGTYSLSGGRLTMTMQGHTQTMQCTFEGNDRMILEEGPAKIVMTRT